MYDAVFLLSHLKGPCGYVAALCNVIPQFTTTTDHAPSSNPTCLETIHTKFHDNKSVSYVEDRASSFHLLCKVLVAIINFFN